MQKVGTSNIPWPPLQKWGSRNVACPHSKCGGSINRCGG